MKFSSRGISPRLVFNLCIALLLAFAVAVFCGAVLRYGFDSGSVKLEDFIRYTFSSLVILSVLVAFISHSHVQVKLRSSFKITQNKYIARLLSALPFLVVAFLSLPSIYFSWSIFEGSREPEGLGGLFLVKTLLPVTFVIVAFFLFFARNDRDT